MTTFLSLNSFVLAGMPTISLTDIARMRLDTLSFFVVVIVGSAWVIRFLWNALQRDFQKLPRLSYRGALAGVVLWGLAFVIVLTMISGARELMTPGAWEKNGLTYRLSGSADHTAQPDNTDSTQDTVRQDRLRALWAALSRVAAARRLPDEIDEQIVSAELLQPPGVVGGRYVFGSCRDFNGPPQLLAFEPDYFPNGQYALFSNGTVQLLDSAAIAGMLDIKLSHSDVPGKLHD